jgi:RNA polymerase sigma factor (sigma-70 family)
MPNIEQFWKNHHQPAIGYCMRKFKTDEETAKEIVSRAISKFLIYANPDKSMSEWWSYFRKICVTEFAEWYNDQKTEKEKIQSCLLEPQSFLNDTLSTPAIDFESRMTFEAKLEEVTTQHIHTPHERIVIKCKSLQWKNKQIALFFGVDQRTVRNWLKLIKLKADKFLEE